MADQEPSAAAKVFVIPELVENILEKLAEDDNIDELQPLTCISAVQRVSILFHDTITTSKKIQSLMATPLDDNKDGMFDFFDGTLWLNIAGCYKDYKDMTSYLQMEIVIKDHEKFKSGKFREGSWRKVSIQGDSESSIWVERLCQKFHEGLGGFEMECDATLGDLVDDYFAAKEAEQEEAESDGNNRVWMDSGLGMVIGETAGYEGEKVDRSIRTGSDKSTGSGPSIR
ncbi:hypothetical protein PRZ48_006948 [Zasmidium cellare]|uniref:F-box domain-containing protein n=1 Tax=Zasmidium cellare TaxID=395010 RepID=A0ABR0EI04_ZASCE|nr:hypothetical protein PRZ48_006948 [Zasmidium cellare]